MSVHVCRYCCEPISEEGTSFSRHPELCASCSSVIDGMGELPLAKALDLERDEDVVTVPE